MCREKCSHCWEMTNVVSGLIVMKKCFQYGKVSSCFCLHDKPPVESCYEEDHFWNFVEANPTFHFDLKCSKCGTLVKLDELVGLMLCTGCDEACEVDVVRRKLEPEGVRVCIALGRRPIDERKQLSTEKIAILEDYFSQQRDCLSSKMTVVSHEMVKNIDSCYAEVVRNVDALFVTAGEEK